VPKDHPVMIFAIGKKGTCNLDVNKKRAALGAKMASKEAAWEKSQKSS